MREVLRVGEIRLVELEKLAKEDGEAALICVALWCWADYRMCEKLEDSTDPGSWQG